MLINVLLHTSKPSDEVSHIHTHSNTITHIVRAASAVFSRSKVQTVVSARTLQMHMTLKRSPSSVMCNEINL
mgnify:CR=1 FL=1